MLRASRNALPGYIWVSRAGIDRSSSLQGWTRANTTIFLCDREGTMRHTTMTILGLAALLLLTEACAGTTVQPGQRGLRWYPFTEGLSSEPLPAGFYWRAAWNEADVNDVKLPHVTGGSVQ